MAVALLASVSAEAHNSHGWFWSNATAETRILYSPDYDIDRATCLGYGQYIKRYNEALARYQRLYRHFDCYVHDQQEGREELILHVKGRYAFTLTYAN